MIPVAVAGATGAVGQRFLQLLDGHPTFEVVAVSGGPDRNGTRLGDATWALDGDWPAAAAELKLQSLDQLARGVRVIFSALPSQQATDMERTWAESGIAVFTNASSHRMDDDVPLLIPEINAAALSLVEGRTGFIVANGNCSGIIVTLALAPLQRAFGLEEVHVMTQQAVSGAGIGGVNPADIHDNVIPFIRGEEEKLAQEPCKTLDAVFPIHVTCTRVDISDGHLASIHATLSKDATWDEVEQAFSNFAAPEVAALPSSPEAPIVVRTEADRPQPRLDRDAGKGMSVSVGRIRVVGKQVQFIALGHNTIRGAAGQSVLNAECAHARGLI